VSVAACARCQSRCAQSPRREESRLIASSVVSRRLSPRREESRVIASSVVSRRLSQSPRREKSRLIASSVVSCRVSSRRASSRCSCRVSSRRASSRCSVSVASCAESCLPPLSLCVVRSHRVVRSLASSGRLSSCVVCHLVVRRPPARRQTGCALGV